MAASTVSIFAAKLALARRRSAFSRLARIVPPDQRARFGARRSAGDQDRRRRRRRHADTFAARMAFLPEALDQFLILNGLERGAPLVAGRRYKMVTQ